MVILLLALPWAMASANPRGGIWPYAVANLIVLAVAALSAVRRMLAAVPETIRVTLQRGGVVQEMTAPLPAVLSAMQWPLLLLYFVISELGTEIANGSLRPIIVLYVGVMVLIPCMFRQRPKTRTPIPWATCCTVELRATAPGRAMLRISRTKRERQHPVDADLDLDEQQMRWLEERIRVLQGQAEDASARSV